MKHPVAPPARQLAHDDFSEAAVDRVLIIAATVALCAFFGASFVLDRAVEGRLHWLLQVVLALWVVIYAGSVPLVDRASSMGQLRGVRAMNLVVAGIGALATCYLLGGAVWVGPVLVFFTVLGAVFVQDRRLAAIYGIVVIAGFAAISAAQVGDWIPSQDPFAGSAVDRTDGTVLLATIGYLTLALVAFYSIAALVGLFVTLQRDLLRSASNELETKKDELQALNNDLEVRVAEKTAELEERNRELAVMAEIGRCVTASLNVETIYLEFLTAARKVITFDMAVVAVYSPDGEEVRFFRARSTPDGNVSADGAMGTEPAATSMHVGETIRFVDDFATIRSVPDPTLLETLSIRSGVQVPVVANGVLLGGFSVASIRPHRFEGHHVALMEQMAEPLALAIDNCRLYDEMREMAETDGLTRLPNRRAIARRIREEIARSARSGELCSVLVLDIDNFKVFNDTLGHQAGDDLLVNFASLLREVCRESDVVARQAGDEFTILLPGSGPRDAIAVSQRIHDALAATDWHYPGSEGVVVRSSIGIACYPMDGEDDDALLIIADRAMYAAKAAGGGQTRIASRLTERESSADSSRQLRFGMLETLANRLASRADGGANQMHALATAIANAAWVIGERLALDDSSQQMLRVAALSHAIGVTPEGDPRRSEIDLGLDDDLASLYMQIGRVFVAGSPGLNDAVRVIAYHHRPLASLGDSTHDELARILAVSERYAELTMGATALGSDEAVARMRIDETLDPASVEALHEGLHAPAVWRAA